MYRFAGWLVPTVEKFPRRQKFLLGNRLQVTGWISPSVRAWIERRSRVPLLLEAYSRGLCDPLAEFPEVERLLCDNESSSFTRLTAAVVSLTSPTRSGSCWSTRTRCSVA